MSGLAVAAASSVDWVARWLAIGSLVVSIIAVIVTVVLWRGEGWSLKVEGSTYNSGFGVDVTNVGRQECIVSTVGVRWRSADPPSVGKVFLRDEFPVLVAASEKAGFGGKWSTDADKPMPSKFEIQAFAETAGRLYYSKWIPSWKVL